jgi:DNA-binding transcriptional LysR family regulator
MEESPMVKEKRSMVGELRSLDLNLLVALRALLDEQHVSRAADKAGLTQSGMSRALQRLRTMFNDPLLVKVEHGYELTSRAGEIDSAIEKVLADIQHIMVPSTFDPSQAEGEFRIASLDYELLVLMPSIISELRKRAPGIMVSAVNLGGLDFSPLIRGDVHLAFSAFEQVPPNLYRKRIFDEDKVCLVSTRHSHIDSQLIIEEYKRLDHVWVTLTGPDPGMIDETLAGHGLSRNVTVMVPSFLMAARIVAETDLTAILPRRIAQQFIQNGLLKIVELPFKFPRFPIYQYWHERNNKNPQQQWLRQVVVEVASSMS